MSRSQRQRESEASTEGESMRRTVSLDLNPGTEWTAEPRGKQEKKQEQLRRGAWRRNQVSATLRRRVMVSCTTRDSGRK